MGCGSTIQDPWALCHRGLSEELRTNSSDSQALRALKSVEIEAPRETLRTLTFVHLLISKYHFQAGVFPHVQSFSTWRHFTEGRLEPARLLLWSEARGCPGHPRGSSQLSSQLSIAGEGPNSWSPQPIPIRAAQDGRFPQGQPISRSPMAFMIEWAEENSDLPNLVPILEPLDLLEFFFNQIFSICFKTILFWYIYIATLITFLIFLTGTGNWMRKSVVMPVTHSAPPSERRRSGLFLDAPGARDQRRRSDECCHAGWGDSWFG
jgi:hypothetical protein